MALFIGKRKNEINRQILSKVQNTTAITATSPGSVARSFADAIGSQIGDYYRALDFNLSQKVISTATGTALDRIGVLYDVKRRTTSNLTVTDAKVGAFYFYIDQPFGSDIVIPNDTRIYTTSDDFVGRQYQFSTTKAATIAPGETKVFVSIKPEFTDSVFSAGANTLKVHSFQSPAGTVVKCTNPKNISPQPGYETDNIYREKITKKVRTSNPGSPESLRLIGLTQRGVRDITIREAVYGLGSFDVIVVPEDNRLRGKAVIDVSGVLKGVKPAGTRMNVVSPSVVAVDVHAAILVQSQAARADELLLQRTKNAIIRFLNTFLVGDTLIYNQLVQSIMDVSDTIVDVQITRYAPNGVEVPRQNWKSADKEYIIPGNIEVNFLS